MKLVLVCVAAALFAAPAFADELVASNGKDSVRLTDKPCTSEKVLNQLKPGFRTMMKDANAVVSGQQFRACWVIEGESAHLLYEDGDQGLIPWADFRTPQSA